MKGLGLGSHRSVAANQISEIAPPPSQPVAYISESYFTNYNVEGGSLTFTENQTVDGSGNWLKIKFPKADQTDISGISKSNAVQGHEAQSGFKYKITFDIFLETASKWTQGAGNTEVTMKVYFGNVTNTFSLTPDTTESVDTGIETIVNHGANDLIIYFNTENDLPESEAVFYIKNLDIQTAQSQSDIT